MAPEDHENPNDSENPADSEDPAFWLCLTHDVDRPHKTYQTIHEALTERRLAPLADLHPARNPYWQFDAIRQLEADLGVRSAFYFLSARNLLDRSPRDWLSPRYWIEHLGQYDVRSPAIRGAIRDLDAGGWEVGLHGSYDSYHDPERLAVEHDRLASVLGHSVQGGRQHYLNLDVPETWRTHRKLGLAYDSSLGSSTTYGFEHGYRPLRPFEDEFVVFPLTLMEVALPEPGRNGTADETATATDSTTSTAGTTSTASTTSTDGTAETAWSECERLLAEADANDAVMTVLWHPRYFSVDFPGYRECYRRLIQRALDMGAWVGPPGDLYDRLDTPGGPETASMNDPPSGSAIDGGARERDEPNHTRSGTERHRS